VGKRLVPNHVWHQTVIFVRAIFQSYTWRTPNKFYRECHPKALSVYTCSWHRSLRVSQRRKIHFYQRGNWFLPPWSFTANADQSNENVNCAHVAGTEVCACHSGEKFIFTKRGNWFLPPWSFTANADQSNESVTCAHIAGTEVCACHREKNSFLLNVEIDFYHLGVLPRMPTNQMSVTCAHWES